MSSPARLPRSFSLRARSLAIGAVLFSVGFGVAEAAQTAATPEQAAQGAPAKASAGKGATSGKGESVEQRISSLHAALKITPAEEANWTPVAQAMRENAANMDKLVAEKRTQAPQTMTALDNLTTYQQFAQAHVDGLKNLISAFKSLYTSMSDAQKKEADQVFEDFGHGHGHKAA